MSDKDISGILDTAPFKRGDVVVFRSGGLPMTVVSTKPPVDPSGWSVLLAWMDTVGHFQTVDISADLLEFRRDDK